jgi:hypothetical protein
MPSMALPFSSALARKGEGLAILADGRRGGPQVLAVDRYRGFKCICVDSLV